MTTVAKHSTAAETWTPDAWVTKARYRVAGEAGFPRSSSRDGGLAAILSAILPVTGAVPLGVGSRAGGASGGGSAGRGGRASVVGSIVAAGGGGSGWGTIRGEQSPGGGGGNAAAPGTAGGDGQIAGSGTGTQVAAKGGGADGSGGAAGINGGANGNAGASDSSGGTGGAGKAYGSGYSGGGGAGFGGGGSGGVTYDPAPVYLGDGGAAGSSTFGTATDGVFEGYNDGAPYIDVLIAAAPLQPTPLSPTGNMYIDRTIDQLFTFQSNPASADSLDAQTDAIFEYRLIATPANDWTAIDDLGTATAATIPAGTLAIGSYEGRFRTKADGGVGDEFGIWGPNSEVFYFRADNPATAPTITSPAASDVVAVNSVTAAWTVAAQTSYQMRVLGDNAGAPDAGTIYADSGEQVSTDRTKTLTVNANHVPAHVQVRVRDKTNGVWSSWASVAVTIEWAGPPKPRVTLATDVRSIHVTVTNPLPVGVEPVADRIEVYVIEGDTRQRRAILAPGDGWIYETPPSGVDVGIEAVAIYTPTNVQTSSGVIY